MKENKDITDVTHILRKVSGGSLSAVSAAAQKSGITKQEADLLLFVFDNPGCTMENFAGLYGFSEDFAAQAVSCLCSSGLAKPDGTGRLNLTGRGGIIGKSLSAARQKYYEGLFCKASAAELEQLKSVIKELSDNVY